MMSTAFEMATEEDNSEYIKAIINNAEIKTGRGVCSVEYDTKGLLGMLKEVYAALGQDFDLPETIPADINIHQDYILNASKQIKETNSDIRISLNVYDIISSLGGEESVGNLTHENSDIDITIHEESTYKNVNRVKKIEFPELTEENSVNFEDLFPNDYYDEFYSYNAWDAETDDVIEKDGKYQVFVSSVTGQGVEELKNRIAHLVSDKPSDKKLVGDLINPLDIVVLVIPIDSAAPKGRLILPQQQVIRDILEAGGVSVVCKDTELAGVLDKPGIKPRMVITDSQAFAEVSKITPEDIYLTSFSILMARWKGFLSTAVKGADALSTIKDGDEILIAEGCTHHRQCEDIGTVKLPRLIRKYTGAEPKFTFTSGGDFPEDLSKYKIILQCGGCMLNEKAVRYRMRTAIEQGVPFTNYGTAIAKMNGILERSVQIVADEVYEKR